MAWYLTVWHGLTQAALGSFLVLVLGCLAAGLCRQPVRRLRVAELTLLGGLLGPCLGWLPGWPRWPVGWSLGSSAAVELPTESAEEGNGQAQMGQANSPALPVTILATPSASPQSAEVPVPRATPEAVTPQRPVA